MCKLGYCAYAPPYYEEREEITCAECPYFEEDDEDG